MGFLTRRPTPDRIEPRAAMPERRAAPDVSWSALAMGAGASTPGAAVSPTLAETIGAVSAAVDLIAGTLASLPAFVADDEGNPASSMLPAARVVSRPNARTGWPALMRAVAADLLLRGNALVRMMTDGRGGVETLTPIPWAWVNPQIVTGRDGASLVFDVVVRTPAAALLNLPDRLLGSEVIHLRWRTNDGVLGISPLGRAGGVIHDARALADAGHALWRNSVRPSGLLTSPEYISEEQEARARAVLNNLTGAMATGRTPLLEGGWSFQPLTVNAADSQLLESRKHAVAEVARLFNIPEPLLQIGDRLPSDMAPFTAQYAQMCIAPIVAEIEAEFSAAIMPSGFRLQIDLGGLLRGAFTSQAAAFATLVQSRIATPNDARSALGLPQHADGDTLASGAAPSFPRDAIGMPSLAPKPGPGGALPNVGTNQGQGAA